MPTLSLKPHHTSFRTTLSKRPASRRQRTLQRAKALINFLMEDRFFLALYRSNDPKVRAAAMDKLNEAHHQAYGDVSAQDDDAAFRRR